MAYGAPALREVGHSLLRLKKMAPDLPVALICDEPTPYTGIKQIYLKDRSYGARWAKLNLDTLTPFERTLYLDADTRVMSRDIVQGFEILKEGWDLVIVPSQNQGKDLFSHLDRTEREETLASLWNPRPLQLQAGVMWFNLTTETLGSPSASGTPGTSKERVHKFFELWRAEWEKYERHDQAALIRALEESSLRIWLLGHEYNSRHGKVIEHLFGRAKL